MNKAGKTACAIAALLHFAAIRIVYTVPELGSLARGALNQQQLVTAYTKMPVRDKTYLVASELDVLVNSIDDDKVVADTVHFGEFDLHGSDFTAKTQRTQRLKDFYLPQRRREFLLFL
jgi:hypothetical protein